MTIVEESQSLYKSKINETAFHYCVGLTKVRECLAEVDKASPMIPVDNTLVKTKSSSPSI